MGARLCSLQERNWMRGAKQTESEDGFLEGAMEGVKMAEPDAFDKSPDTSVDENPLLESTKTVRSYREG